MILVRDAALHDLDGIRDVFHSEYGDNYAYPQYYDPEMLARIVYADSSVLLVAIDEQSERVTGTASVVFSVGAHDDLVGEFGRLVVHPDFRGRGIGQQLMRARIDRVKDRIHVGLVDNRVVHSHSQQISQRFGFVPVGFVPMRLALQQRESVAIFAQHFGNSLALRRNNPRVIPEAAALAGMALENCGLAPDAIIDDSAPPFPLDDNYELDELRTEGYTSLLRIERGRLRHRDIFGPVRLHYGLFQLQARHSHYLIARRNHQIAGGIGYMIDDAESAVRVFEMIAVDEQPIRFLLGSLMDKCRDALSVETVEVDVNAHSPRMQRTLLEFGLLPTAYIPANVFHNVERLDALKMTRLLVPLQLGDLQLCESMQPIAQQIIQGFRAKEVPAKLASVSQQAPLFHGLSGEQRQRLLGICRPQSFSAGEVIFKRGDCGSAMHLILSGTVELTSADTPVAQLTVGQCIGETSLVFSRAPTQPHSVDAVAKSALDVASISGQEFATLIRQRPDIGVVMYRNLAADVSTKLRRMHA